MMNYWHGWIKTLSWASDLLWQTNGAPVQGRYVRCLRGLSQQNSRTHSGSVYSRSGHISFSLFFWRAESILMTRNSMLRLKSYIPVCFHEHHLKSINLDIFIYDSEDIMQKALFFTESNYRIFLIIMKSVWNKNSFW